MKESQEISALGHMVPQQRQVKPSLPKTAMSLKPGFRFTQQYVLAPTKARRAVLDSWKLKSAVRIMTLSELAVFDEQRAH
jgi:hypothetical protein